MTWDEARAVLDAGGAVRRADLWYTWLRREDGLIKFQFGTRALQREYHRRTYQPTEIEMAAQDWEAAA